MRLILQSLFLSVCAVVVLTGSTLQAQNKVGVINVQRAVLETAEIKKAQAELEAKFKPRQDELEAAQKELMDIRRQLEGGQNLTPAQQSDLQGRGQLIERRAQRLQEDLQEQVGRDRDAVLGRVGQRMQEIVTKLATEKDLDVVVEASNALFFKPALDITTEAIGAYDKTYPAN